MPIPILESKKKIQYVTICVPKQDILQFNNKLYCLKLYLRSEAALFTENLIVINLPLHLYCIIHFHIITCWTTYMPIPIHL